LIQAKRVSAIRKDRGPHQTPTSARFALLIYSDSAVNVEGMTVSIKFSETYYTTAEAADLLGVKTDTVKMYCNTNRIKGEKVGHIWMVAESEIERYKQAESSLGRPKNISRD
jgi:excisionase family DNA binding protein